MGSPTTDFHAAAAAAFDTLRGMTDAECREAELALFRVASEHHSAPDAAEEVLEQLEQAPHRAFRSHALATIRALSVNLREGGRSPSELRSMLEGYLAGEPDAACVALKASDMDRYAASEKAGH